MKLVCFRALGKDPDTKERLTISLIGSDMASGKSKLGVNPKDQRICSVSGILFQKELLKNQLT